MQRRGNPRNVDGLIAWTRRPEWHERLTRCLDLHTAKACNTAGIDPAEIEDLLGAYAASNVWGAAFEDLLATDLPDGRNLVDEYMRRRVGLHHRAERFQVSSQAHCSKRAVISSKAPPTGHCGTPAADMLSLVMALLASRGFEHPEPTGSRRATPLPLPQHQPGHPRSAGGGEIDLRQRRTGCAGNSAIKRPKKGEPWLALSFGGPPTSRPEALVNGRPAFVPWTTRGHPIGYTESRLPPRSCNITSIEATGMLRHAVPPCPGHRCQLDRLVLPGVG
jgi:hypothetical protein